MGFFAKYRPYALFAEFFVQREALLKQILAVKGRSAGEGPADGDRESPVHRRLHRQVMASSVVRHRHGLVSRPPTLPGETLMGCFG